MSGFNVYPNEIENVVVEMDGILEAAAIGVPDEKSGEIVKIFAVRTDDAVTEHDVRRLLPRQPDRLQAAENHRVPRRPAEDQRRQDPAPRAARRV